MALSQSGKAKAKRAPSRALLVKKTCDAEDANREILQELRRKSRAGLISQVSLHDCRLLLFFILSVSLRE